MTDFVDLAGRCLTCGEYVSSSGGCDCRRPIKISEPRLSIVSALEALGENEIGIPPADTAAQCSQCKDCVWAWHNLQTSDVEDGWCYMFMNYITDCAQHKIGDTKLKQNLD